MLAFLPQGRALRQKPQKLAQFWQKTQKFVLILCVFTFQKNFCYFLGVFLGFHRSAMRCLRLFVCSQCSHFVARQSLASQRDALFTSFPAENSCLLRQKPQKFARFWALRVCALLPQSIFGFLACADCSLGAFWAFSHVRTASPTRFRGKCACALLAWHVLGFLACAHCFPGAFSTFSRLRIVRLARFGAFIAARCAAYRLLSQGSALLTDFLFARNARIFVSQRNALLTEFSCGKLALFFCKNHKNSRLLWQRAQKLAARFRASKVRVHYGDWSKNYKKITEV